MVGLSMSWRKVTGLPSSAFSWRSRGMVAPSLSLMPTSSEVKEGTEDWALNIPALTAMAVSERESRSWRSEGLVMGSAA